MTIMNVNNIETLKEKIQLINPNLTDELLELLTEFFMESIGDKLVEELHDKN